MLRIETGEPPALEDAEEVRSSLALLSMPARLNRPFLESFDSVEALREMPPMPVTGDETERCEAPTGECSAPREEKELALPDGVMLAEPGSRRRASSPRREGESTGERGSLGCLRTCAVALLLNGEIGERETSGEREERVERGDLGDLGEGGDAEEEEGPGEASAMRGDGSSLRAAGLMLDVDVVVPASAAFESTTGLSSMSAPKSVPCSSSLIVSRASASAAASAAAAAAAAAAIAAASSGV
jgi:hypothetical protein